MSSQRSSVKPLSLQHLTFVHLATHLDHYPPDTIALLPCRLRRELLTLLPPVDLLQLEQTSVCEGVNTNEVWKHICQRQDFSSLRPAAFGGVLPTRYISTLTSNARASAVNKDTSLSVGWRTFFVTVACNLLLCAQQIPLVQFFEHSHDGQLKKQHSIYFLLLQYLFCNQFRFSKRYVKERGSLYMFVYGQKVQPPRFAQYTSVNEVCITPTELVMFLTDTCCVYPTSLIVDCDLCNVVQFCEAPNGEKILQLFLSRVQHLCFTSQIMSSTSSLTVTHLLSSIFSSPSPQLVSLSVCLEDEQQERYCPVNRRDNKGNSFLRPILGVIRPFFADFREDSSPEFSPTLSAGMSGTSVGHPYMGLKRLKMSNSHRHPVASSSCAKYFFEIAQAQQQLEELEITGWWTWSEKQTSSVSLGLVCSLFFYSHLSTVELRQLDLPACMVQSLVEAFLRSPSAHRQEFTLYSVWMYGDCKANVTSILNCPWLSEVPAVFGQKFLNFRSMYIPNSFIEWLVTLECIRVNALVLCDIQYDRDMYPGGIVGALGAHKDCQIQRLHLSTHTQYCPSEGLDLLMQNPVLKELTLTGPKNQLFDRLLTGLRHQNTMSNLRKISIRQTSFVTMETCVFEHLATAIVSLPQLANLTLEITDCQLLPEQIISLGRVWRESGEKKLQMFVLRADLPRGFSKCEEPAFLHEIAREVQLSVRTPNKQLGSDTSV